MLRLLNFPLHESVAIVELRQIIADEPGNVIATIGLGVALSASGCTYEAAALLRPLRAQWKTSEDAQQARHALDAQAWWNKNWREFARLKHSGDSSDALALLGNRAVDLWDMPPLLVHLGDIAAQGDRLDLAQHLYQRVFNLSQHGLPKMNMTAFAYVVEAAIVDLMLQSGRPAEALARHQAITPNQGNAMAHEMQNAKVLVATSNFDEAMRQLASTLIIAQKHRRGFSRTMRIEFVDTAAELALLRTRTDWSAMREDPAVYLRDV